MHTIYISPEDNARLRLLLMLMPYSAEARHDVRHLRAELDRAVVMPDPGERPQVIRIGSVFEYQDFRSGGRGARRLCLPADVPHEPNGLSILTRFGAAVIGCSLGDEVAWVTSVGMSRILILGVIPPASASTDHPSA